ncbi:HD domain-containing protein [Candidatus Sumerlaeota bacterium]|nr:HD domain-containing protein [Candidatus Sumerlaeota bacterium]
MSFSKRIRDAVHGFINWDSSEYSLVDKPVFQRLRGIKQLAMAYLVYPCATHTRFDHSLGVFHIASLMTEKLLNEKNEKEEKSLIRKAALLHDLGHGPFSHVSEDALERFYDRGKVKPESKEKIHEMITRDIVQKTKTLDLSDIDKNNICRLLKEGYGIHLYKDIVSGPLDADKLNYLLRDSLFCGVKYGIYDLEQILNSMCREKWDDSDECLMLDDDGVFSLEQFILAKYYITNQVYKHRIRRISDSMISRAIIWGVEKDEIVDLKKLYSYDGSGDFVENYILWDDDRFLLEFSKKEYKGKVIFDMIKRLKERKLFKRIYSESVSNFEDFPSIPYELGKITVEDPKSRDIESKISDKLNLKPYEVIFKVYTSKNVYGGSKESEEQIMIKTSDGIKPFSEKSSLFNSIGKEFFDREIECYAAVEYSDAQEKSKKEREYKTLISDIIKSEFTSGGEIDHGYK